VIPQEYDFVVNTLIWIAESQSDFAKFLRSLHRFNSLSEVILHGRIASRNISQLNPDPLFSFITLRTRVAIDYCRMTRFEFIETHKKPGSGLDKSDILTGIPYRSTPLVGFDLVANPVQRCGNSSSVNVTEVCLILCRCGPSLRNGHSKEPELRV
jgi:hypothetical protein